MLVAGSMMQAPTGRQPLRLTQAPRRHRVNRQRYHVVTAAASEERSLWSTLVGAMGGMNDRGPTGAPAAPAASETDPKAPTTSALKAELLSSALMLQRGLLATPRDEREVEELVQALEARNPTPAPLSSPLLTGKWELRYTTSAAILGKDRHPWLRPDGPIYQTLDGATLSALNEEILRLPLCPPLPRMVAAALTPVTDSLVNVQFKRFGIGSVRFPAPESAKGTLDTTYLDADLRISRGNKANLFVLTMADRQAALPGGWAAAAAIPGGVLAALGAWARRLLGLALRAAGLAAALLFAYQFVPDSWVASLPPWLGGIPSTERHVRPGSVNWAADRQGLGAWDEEVTKYYQRTMLWNQTPIGIASAHNISLDELAYLNPEIDLADAKFGTKLWVPRNN